jgi:hypothetical protein
MGASLAGLALRPPGYLIASPRSRR